MAENDTQASDAVTQAAVGIEKAVADIAKDINAIASVAVGAAISVEMSASDVAKADAQQATDIQAQRLADVRAQVKADNAKLRAGQYVKL